jgi:hypothetical protein
LAIKKSKGFIGEGVIPEMAAELLASRWQVMGSWPMP